MCGIAGILTSRSELEMAPALEAMRRALRHRGPDDEGQAEVELGGGVRLGLCQTRLAILDLSPAGHQPMLDGLTGSSIVFNGEIYNHQTIRSHLNRTAYRSTSDTETILAGWAEQGDGILQSLRGMFALAIHDARRRKFWLVRGRLGVKPLYAAHVGPDLWLFASEVRALLASGLVPRALNARAVDSYLAFGAVVAPRSFIDGVCGLLPGEAWCFDLETTPLQPTRRRYWRPSFAPRDAQPVSHGEALERLRPVLLEAVSLRMVSDVPVGVFLSGGIDSSCVVALLAEQGHTLHTFSVVFGESAYDESTHSRAVARRYHTKHTELHLRPEDVLSHFDDAMRAYDQPSIDGLNTYFIARATRQANVKVALSGLGGDELFAGYSYFRLLADIEGGLKRGLAKLLLMGLRRFAPESSRTDKLEQILGSHGSRLLNYNACRQVMPRSRRDRIQAQKPHPAGGLLPAEVGAALEAETAVLDPVNAHSLLELTLYLENMLLRDTDQMSMAHALEVREPLLDHVLVETVAALPGPLKIRRGRSSRLKALLTDCLPNPLPSSIVNRPKMGFVLPWENWLREELRPSITALLTDRDAVEAATLNPPAVGALWDDFLNRKPGIRYSDIFCLANLIHWASQHRLKAVTNTPLDGVLLADAHWPDPNLWQSPQGL
jgi:asparagine synthase (glutamine-hydrolysing)